MKKYSISLIKKLLIVYSLNKTRSDYNDSIQRIIRTRIDNSSYGISDRFLCMHGKLKTATQIFLPNLKATDVYRSAFMLSQREYILIKTTDPA